MISIFRTRSPGNIFLLFFFGLLLKLPLFIYPKTIVATQNDEAIYHAIIRFLGSGNAFTCSLISFLLLYIQAIMINYLINAHRLLPRPTYLPGMSYLLLTTLLPQWNYLSAALLASTFIIWIFISLFRLYNMPTIRGAVFNIGLLLGISTYIYFPSAALFICVALGLAILKPFRVNEIIIFLMGCFTPYYFLAAYLLLTNQFSFSNLFPNVYMGYPVIRNSIWLAISTAVLCIPFFIGGYFVQQHLNKILIQVRKCWSIILLYLLVCFFIPFINAYPSLNNWLLLATPFACFHAAFYYYPRNKWIVDILFFLITGYIVYQEYWTKLWM